MLVAVYGTLKKGEVNYLRLLPGLEPVFQGFVEIPYVMYENGEYPMLLPSSELNRVGVDVFDVDEKTLAALDALEDPYDYRRQSVYLKELRGEAAIYVHPPPPPPGFTLLASGDWTASRI